MEKKKQKTAWIGAGPTAAILLAQQGYGVTIFEWRDKIGDIMPNTIIGTVLKIENLLRNGYSSVFVGTGVWKARNLGIHGECLGNVYFGTDYLANVESMIRYMEKGE